MEARLQQRPGNAAGARPLVLPPDAAPLTATAPKPVYVKDDMVLPYEPHEPWESL
jgi:hypothetical protein